uniref:Uncharacterized protein n=1 Tax=Parascaris univalens TaxID=6257 RepID=A0A915A5I0_PARUN
RRKHVIRPPITLGYSKSLSNFRSALEMFIIFYTLGNQVTVSLDDLIYIS